ncbi:MAG TPA: hypothetical protein VE596_07695 [Gaiellaceae bacterium]|nr:hypothetical protein [Gaiellaceae bacterium]
MGATVLVIGLGDLGTRVLDALARLPEIERLVGAGRDEERGRARAGQAAFVAELLGGPRRVEFERVDLVDVAAAASLLRRLDPDLVVTAASRHTWWLPFADERVDAMPMGVWLPLQLVLVRRLMEARREAGVAARVLSLPYPDGVGPALAPFGLAPELGAGNVAETAPKLALLAAHEAGVARDEVRVRLVMHHAAQRVAFGDDEAEEAPWTAEVRVRDEPLPRERVERLFRAPWPLPSGRDTHELSAAATAHAVRALLREEPTATHAPAPNGLPGGYPVRLSRGRVELDLPEGLELTEAIALNERAAAFDGIERIELDGTVVLTAATAEAAEKLLGLRLERVGPHEMNDVADELVARTPRR